MLERPEGDRSQEGGDGGDERAQADAGEGPWMTRHEG